MNTGFLNCLGRLAVLIIFSLGMSACGGGGSTNTNPATAIPGAPNGNLTATVGDESIKLSWDAVAGADSYNVYRSDTPGTGVGGTEITGVKPPFYDNGLSNGAAYYYVVTAVNTVGESAASTEVSAVPVNIPITSLVFADPNLQGCLTSEASFLSYIYVHDVTSLECFGGPDISDLSGVEALTSLTYLDFYGNSISDASPLAGLTGLNHLTLSSTNVSDLSSLVGLKDLTFLDLTFNNNISDLSALTGLTKLTDLRLSNNSISDLSPLAGLTNLTHLELGSNSISDVSALSNLTNLMSLYLQSNKIGGQGVGHIDTLSSLSGSLIELSGNLGVSCIELGALISALPLHVDTDGNLMTSDVATDGVNCTNP